MLAAALPYQSLRAGSLPFTCCFALRRSTGSSRVFSSLLLPEYDFGGGAWAALRPWQNDSKSSIFRGSVVLQLPLEEIRLGGVEVLML